MEATVSEIHAYPLRPEGFAEPLFHSHKSRQQILDHLARSDWLFRASQARSPEAPRPPRTLTDDAAKETARIIASWREVDRWWQHDGGVDVIWRLVETPAGRQEARAKPLRERSAGAA